MKSCSRAAELISQSLETPLGWRDRLALGVHLFLCGLCRRFHRQMEVVQRAGRVAEEHGGFSEALPEAARDRIRAALRVADEGGDRRE
jgi:hypothetical protein